MFTASYNNGGRSSDRIKLLRLSAYVHMCTSVVRALLGRGYRLTEIGKSECVLLTATQDAHASKLFLIVTPERDNYTSVHAPEYLDHLVMRDYIFLTVFDVKSILSPT